VKVVGEHLHFFRATATGQVPGEQQQVRPLGQVGQAWTQDVMGSRSVMEVANGCDPDHDTGSSPSGSPAATTVVSLTIS